MAVTGKTLSQLMELIDKECGSTYMEERSYSFSETVKQELKKWLFVEKALPDMGTYEIDYVSYMDGCKVYFTDGSWVIARFSGTEPLLRIFCEMPTKEEAEAMCDRFWGFLEERKA